MASFFHTTIGQQIEFQRVLASAGFTETDVTHIIKEPALASAMYKAIQAEVKVSLPTWYLSPEQQLECVNQLNVERNWGFSDSDFPSVPEHFVPRTPTEVLMLAVYLPPLWGKVDGLQRTFDELWDLVQVPQGSTKYRWNELESDSKHLGVAFGHAYEPGIRWVAFDPNAFHGKSPQRALQLAEIDNPYLAGVEILMAALLFPTWPTGWNGDSSPFPNLSGLQLYGRADSRLVPYLGWRRDGCQLRLDAIMAGNVHASWASPTVREC